MTRRREVVSTTTQFTHRPHQRQLATTMQAAALDASPPEAVLSVAAADQAEVDRRTPPRSPPTPLSTSCEDHWSWNKNDKSHEVRLYGPKQRIAHFHPNWSNGTAGVRGTRALNGGRFYWEINVSQRLVRLVKNGELENLD